MGNGLIFPYWSSRVMSEWGDAEGWVDRVMDVPAQGCRRVVQANPHGRHHRDPMTRGDFRLAKRSTPRCQEKPLSQLDGHPYRKPTQVGEESILRRVRETSLRISAT